MSMLQRGQRFGPYEILDPLGSGGMGEVYRARDPRLDRLVAIKVLPTETLSDPERRDRFEREAKAIAALNHPNIVTIHSIEEQDEVPFLTMELVDGTTLAQMIPAAGLKVDRFLDIATALADALSAAHQKGIVHRDLKPANVMVTGDGRVKVLDFGLAKLREAVAPAGASAMSTQLATADGRILGTVAYMSPEQAEGRPTDHRSDIFSLGIVLYEMAAGERPFTADNTIALLSSITRDTPIAIAERRADMPAHVSRLIRRCLEKDPLRRVQDALDIRNDLDEIRNDLHGSPSASRPAIPRRWLAASVSLVLLGAAAAWLWMHRGTMQTPRDDADRVVVARFENRTGDRSFDALGQLTADALIQGLTEIQVADVAPAPVALTASGESAPYAPWARSDARGLIVTGAFYVQGSELRLQAHVIDARTSRLLYALQAGSESRADPGRAVDELKQRMMSFAAAYFAGHMDARLFSYIPRFEAWREFDAGIDLFGANYREAVRHFERASELEPAFLWPWFMTAMSHINLGEFEKAQPIVDRLAASRDRYSEFERYQIDWAAALLAGDRLKGLDSLQKAQRLDPNWLVLNFLVAAVQYQDHRPRDAIETIRSRPLRNERELRYPFSTTRHSTLTLALHDLGEYDQELQVSREAQRARPDSMVHREQEARALAGLGRMEELNRFVDQTLGLRSAATGAGDFLTAVAQELRAHSHPADAHRVAARAVTWLRARPPDVVGRPASRFALARALELAGKETEARDLLMGLVKDVPENVDYEGKLGALSARLGDRATADKLADELRVLARPYLFGTHTYWRAAIAAAEGEKDAAVDLLREAFAQGRAYSVGAHRDVNLESLRGYRPYEELVSPRR